MPDAPSLKIEAGECVTLSPNSERFKSAYQQIMPRSAAQVRATLGLSDAAAKAVQEQRACCQRVPAVVPRADDLQSEDAATRTAARSAAYATLQAYVNSPTPGAFAYVTPVLDRYLEISKAILNLVTLADIDVADGATLTISKNTHVVYANKVTIHGSGRIVCQGTKTFKVASVEGTHPLVLTTVGTTVFR